MKGLIFQIKYQINQPEYKICFSMLLIFSLGGFLLCFTNSFGRDYMYIRSAAENFLLVATDARILEMVFALLFPLLAALLCAGCRRKSEVSGDGLNVILRMKKRSYVMGNACAVVILTFLSFAAVLTINQILCMVAFPVNGYDNRWGMPIYRLIMDYDSKKLFDIWTIQNPYIYNVLYSLIISILAGGIALLAYGLGLTRILKKVKTIQISVFVFVLFMLLFAMGEVSHIPMLSFTTFVETGHTVSFGQYLIFAGVIYLTGIILVIKGQKIYEYI